MKSLILLFFLTPLISSAQAPANDNPCGATNLTVNPTCNPTNFSMVNATYNASFPVNGNCLPDLNNSNPGDVWFKCTVPSTGNVVITTGVQAGSADNDGVMQAFSSSSCSVLNYISCNDDSVGLMPALTISGRTPGEVLYFKIYQFTAGAVALYTICATTFISLNTTSKVGIGIATPDSTLDVNGHLLVRGGIRLAGDVKITKGSPGAGKVLTSDAEGNASWQPLPTALSGGSGNLSARNIPATGSEFYVFEKNTQVIPAGAQSKKLGFNSGARGSLFNNADSSFTVTVSGMYEFDIKLTIEPFTSLTGKAFISFLTETGTSTNVFYIPDSGRENTISFSVKEYITAGAKYALSITNTSSGPITLKGSKITFRENYFKGYLMK